MNKLFSIVIAGLILVQSFNIHLNDIAELDKLIEHARFHSEQHGDDFFVFLSKHYGKLKEDHSRKHQEEKKDHERLPFQNHCPTVALSAFVIHNSDIETPNPEFCLLQKNPGFFYSATYPSLEKAAPFQPPRKA